MRQGAWGAGLVSLGLVLALVGPAPAVITRLTALSEVLEEASIVVTAKVEKLDAKRPAMVLAVDEALKGKPGFKSMPVLLAGDVGAVKRKEPPLLLKRLAEKLPLVVFVTKSDDEYTAFGYSNGTWFSMTGVKVDGELRWSFSHLEPYLRRTYKGTTREMVQTVRDALAGKRKPPPANAKEKPGLGPEVPTKKERGGLDDERPVRGVIVAPLVMGPLAMLAMLFPTAFGGWKRWLVLISTAATNSTLYGLHWWFSDDLVGTWWGTSLALWTAMGIVNVAGLAWAWQRHLALVQAGEAPACPGKAELIVLGVVALLGVGVLVTFHQLQQNLLTPAWLPLVAFCVAVWLGCLYALYARLRRPRMMPAVGTEAVVLTGLLLASLVLGTTLQGRVVAGGLEQGDREQREGVSVERVWTFRLPTKGAISSSPVVVGDRVYIAAAHDSAFRPHGALYCLDRATGKEVWSYRNKKMKPVFSTPVVENGKLYIGEGFHQDYECKVYCFDAATGKVLWNFQAGSHTESTPCLADGRLYIGAGDDGLYCLDAARGKKLWNFPAFHIDAPPLVAAGRVYAGCGIGDTYRETALFCLDATRKGKPIWRMNTDYPVWSRPVVSGGFVYAGTGNGRLNESADNPGGAVLCLRASDGEVVWRQKFGDGVLGPLAADRRHLYFGCRDGHFYCLRRKDGGLAWRRDLGSAVVAGPALEGGSTEAPAGRLYAASIAGHLSCLESQTGKRFWSRDLAAEANTEVELISTPALEALRDPDGAEVWRLYVGVTLVSTGRAGELHCFEDRTQATE
jgi:outer membrane protein assembly factor BamB